MAQGLKIWRGQVVAVFPQAPFRVTNVPGHASAGIIQLCILKTVRFIFRPPRSLQPTGGPPKLSEPLNHPRFSEQLKPSLQNLPDLPGLLSSPDLLTLY